jgi:hypothetical protein
MGNDYNCPPICPRCNKLHYTNQTCERTALGPSGATACNPSSLTPETDAIADEIYARGIRVSEIKMLQHAQKMERERNEAHQLLRKAIDGLSHGNGCQGSLRPNDCRCGYMGPLYTVEKFSSANA